MEILLKNDKIILREKIFIGGLGMKKRVAFWVFLAVISLFLTVPVFAAEGKMNTAVICGTNDAKKSTAKMEKVLAANKLSRWRLNKQESYYYDATARPATVSSVDQILDRAFGGSTGRDINYLFIAAHGYPGSSENDKVYYKNTGLILNTNTNEANGVYKFKALTEKLIRYQGQFVVILDCCFSDNFYQEGILSKAEYAGRFTVLCSSDQNEYAYGALGTQFTTGRMVKVLTPDKKTGVCPADVNKDGFISLSELYYAVKGKTLSKLHAYGNKGTQLFQFGYVKLSKRSAEVNLEEKKSYSLSSFLKKYQCTLKQTVKWKSSDSSVASVSKNGKVTLKKAGTAKITAYLADSSGNMCLGSESSCTITAKAPEIKLAASQITLYTDQKTTLKAAVSGSSKHVKWSVSGKGIASVSKKGKNKATITAKKKGTATITASIGKVKATAVIKVKDPVITLDKTSLSLKEKQKETLTATVEGSSQTVKWKTSNSKIVSISKKKNKVTLTAKKAGTVTITASVGKSKASCKVTVQNVDWKSLYYDFLKNSETSFQYREKNQTYTVKGAKSFYLVHLNNDTIPELAVSKCASYDPTWETFWIFTIKNGKVVYSGEINKRGEVELKYNAKQKALYSSWWTNGNGGAGMALWNLNNGTLQQCKYSYTYLKNGKWTYANGNKSSSAKTVSKAQSETFDQTYFSSKQLTKCSRLRNTESVRQRQFK